MVIEDTRLLSLELESRCCRELTVDAPPPFHGHSERKEGGIAVLVCPLPLVAGCRANLKLEWKRDRGRDFGFMPHASGKGAITNGKRAVVLLPALQMHPMEETEWDLVVCAFTRVATVTSAPEIS